MPIQVNRNWGNPIFTPQLSTTNGKQLISNGINVFSSIFKYFADLVPSID